MPDGRKHCFSSTVLALAVGMGALCAALIALRVLPLGVLGEWHWPRSPAPRWDELAGVSVAFVLFAGCLLGSLTRLSSTTRAQRAAAVILLSALAGVLWLACARLSPAGLYEMPFTVAVPKSNAYFYEATTVKSLKHYLARYEENLRRNPLRVQLSTHPAGPVVMFYAVQQLFRWSPYLTGLTLNAARWLAPPDGELEATVLRGLLPAESSLRAAVWGSALLLISCAVLTLPALYALCSKLLSPACGLSAVGLLALCPAFHLFSPALDQTLAFLGVVILLILLVAAEKNSLAVGLAGGVLVIVALQFSISLIVVIAAGAGALMLARPPLLQPPPFRALIGALVGFSFLCGILIVLFDYNPFGVWLECARQNTNFNRIAGRTYASWLAVNTVEWAVFLGMPVAVLSSSLAVRPFCCAFSAPVYAVLLILNLAGVNRGEVGRLWMPLMPLACIAAAGALECVPRKRAWLAALLLMQFAGVIALKLLLDALGLYQAV